MKKLLAYHGPKFSTKSHVFVPALVEPEAGVEVRVVEANLPDLKGVELVEGPELEAPNELHAVGMITEDNVACKVTGLGETFIRHGLHWYPANGVAYIPEEA